MRRCSIHRPSIRVSIEPLKSRDLLSFVPAVTYATGATPTAVVTADFNNDQHVDFAIPNGGDGNVSVALGNGERAEPHPGARLTFGIASGDFNGDLHPDIVTADLYGIDASILMNAADWSPAPIVSPPQARNFSESVEDAAQSLPVVDATPNAPTRRHPGSHSWRTFVNHQSARERRLDDLFGESHVGFE